MFICEGIDISTTGILLKVLDKNQADIIQNAEKIVLDFEILPGTMPEGYEMKVKQNAKLVRTATGSKGEILCGFAFDKDLSRYSAKKKDRYMLKMQPQRIWEIRV